MEDSSEEIYQKLFLIFDSICRLTEEEKLKIRELATIRIEPAKSNIVEEGRRANKMFFLVKGAVRCFHYYDGVEKNIWFTFENNFITSFTGFITGGESPETIQTLEESEFVVFTRESLFKLIDNNSQINLMYRNVLEATVVEKERALQRHYYTATEKYKNLIELNPEVIQRVPLGYIASYLGVNQSTLSRIRKK